MEKFWSKRLGWIEYSPEAVVEFPTGLPAFEQERNFVLIERPEIAPILYLQSLRDEALCFLSAPAQALASDYSVSIGSEESGILGDGVPDDFLCLALITLPEQGAPTANLVAPIVIHRRRRKACQVVQTGVPYSFTHPLGGTGPCS